MMECNRDEALRACEIAERKFRSKDVAGAKKLAIKALNLYPALEGIMQMVATLDVHLASETVVNGEKDWYAILGVSASADDEEVKKQYRKLALLLHPDKNKAVGAEAAFKLVSEAWSVLCDKTRRMVYDQKRNGGVNHQNSHTSTNGFFHHGKQKNESSAGSSTVAPPNCPPQSSTFWTSCHNCKMQYEYLRIYVNHNLLCPNCHKPFLAMETPNPTNGHNPAVPWSSSQRQHSSNGNRHAPPRQKKSTNSVSGKGSSTSQHGSNLKTNSRNFQSVTFTRPSVTATASYTSESTNMFHSVYGNIKREEELGRGLKRDSSFGRIFPEGDPNYYDVDRPEKRRRGTSEDIRDDYTRANWDVKDGSVQGNHTYINQIQNLNGIHGDYAKFRTYKYGSLKREMPHLDIRSMLMRKGQTLVQKKLELLRLETSDRLAGKENKKQKDKQRERVTSEENGASGVNEDLPNVAKEDKVGKCFNKATAEKSVSDADTSTQQPMHIDVLDPDFYNFDGDRSEACFEPDQIWATYDDEDGMPRLYALVQKVISKKPFKVRMSFLTSKSNSELGHLNWVGMGFAKTCGEFRVSRYTFKDSINIFSHQVQWEKGPRGVIKIVPRQGETWALYRNWSADWNENTPEDVIYKYDMVEVLEDYNEEQGVTVAPLVKVAGFKTVFHRHMDQNQIRRIPRQEMFRFSHQVPSCFLTGSEAKDAPKGCHELDPAALPVELLQVITEAKEADAMGTSQMN